jgi:hypothetical protein
MSASGGLPRVVTQDVTLTVKEAAGQAASSPVTLVLTAP